MRAEHVSGADAVHEIDGRSVGTVPRTGFGPTIRVEGQREAL
jgi:hypothetical protein